MWCCVARAADLPRPGAFRTVDVGRESVLVTRARDHGVRAYLNVCRHRGARLVTEDGGEVRRAFQCPYHAWTYGLDGTLKAAPGMRDEDGFDADNYSLFPVQVDTWGPFIFVNVDLEADSLRETLGILPDTIAETGIDLDSLRFHHRGEYVIEANWKIAVENYLECYHCAVNHPGFVDAVDERALRLESGGARLSQFAPVHPRAVESLAPYDVRGELSMSQFHIFLPAMKFNVCPGRPNLSIGPVWPLAADRCAGYLDYFFAPEADDAWLESFFAYDDQIGREDRALVESVQRGMASGMLEHGRLLAGAEPLLAAFQHWVAERLEADA